MVLSDLLSRQNNDNSNPHEIIPISFNMHKVLQGNYYKIDSDLVHIRSQARKNLDPNIKQEKQHANPIKGSVVKLCIGQGRAGLKRKRSDPINQAINQPSELSQKIPGKTKIETGKTNQVHSKDPMHTVNNVDTGMTHTRPNPCSFPSRSDLQAPSQTYWIKHTIKSGKFTKFIECRKY